VPGIPTGYPENELAMLGGLVVGFLAFTAFNFLLRRLGTRVGPRLLLIGLGSLGVIAIYFFLGPEHSISFGLVGLGLAGIAVVMLELRQLRIERAPKKWF